MSLNKHTIKLIDGKQLSYRLIYALSLVKLETLKTYIETYLKIRFIQSPNFLINALILFDKSFDGSFCLCVNYQGLNNLRIKNQYSFPLIDESLD